MKVGYSFWGFLGDVKMNEKFEEISTPDGNALYSWSIIKALQDKGHEVYRIMPDRDRFGMQKLNADLFGEWCKEERFKAYAKMRGCCKSFGFETEEEIMKLWNEAKLNELDCVLHEWRMEIAGRNDEASRGKEGWQPDLFLQNCLIKYCRKNGIKLVVFDLDYKISEEQFEEIADISHLLELGTKWQSTKFANIASKVYIPFCFDRINELDVKNNADIENDLVYVGNRYERDWCIDKYIPEDMAKCIVYGNWKESGRDSESRWPNIRFGKRLQTADMYKVYSNSICTILLAKKEYCKYSFMTARIIEAIFYGTVPLFIEEYGKNTINEYAGAYANFLTVRSKQDVVAICDILRQNEVFRKRIIEYMRSRLSFMDAKNFVQMLENVI